MSRPVVVALGAVVIAATASGLALDASGFAVNLLAGVVDTAIGVVVAVTLVEQMLRRQRESRWAHVRNQILRAIHAQIADLALDIYMTTSIGYGVEGTSAGLLEALAANAWPRSDIVKGLRRMSAYAHEHAEELGSPRESNIVVIPDASAAAEALAEAVAQAAPSRVIVDSEETARSIRSQALDDASTKTLYRETRQRVRHLRDVLTPRLLELGDDPKLVALLAAVDDVDRRWAAAIAMIDDWGAPEKSGWEEVSALLAVAADVEAHLLENYADPTPEMASLREVATAGAAADSPP